MRVGHRDPDLLVNTETLSQRWKRLPGDTADMFNRMFSEAAADPA